MKISLFASSLATEPKENISIVDFIEHTRTGKWQSLVERVRAAYGTPKYRELKSKLPAVTISGTFTTRNKLKNHSGFICIDIDKKNNPGLRPGFTIDKDCYAQFASCSGEGVKIIYRCKAVKDAAQHRRIFDAIVARIKKKSPKLVIDLVVKSVASLQYVSYDEELYFNPKTKLVVAPLPPIKMKAKPAEADIGGAVADLNQFIEALGDRDITADYENWISIIAGLSYSLGERGREPMHRICSRYPAYDADECDEKYDDFLERAQSHNGNVVTLSTVFHLINNALPKVTIKQLARTKRLNHTTTKGTVEAVTDEITGLVPYGMFLFKKIIDKESGKLEDLVIDRIGQVQLQDTLAKLGFTRNGSRYLRTQNNIVEEMSLSNLIIAVYDSFDKDYCFSVDGVEFTFGYKELRERWKEGKGLGQINIKIESSVREKVPDILKDTLDCSYVPYLNGVVRVDKKGFKLIPYAELPACVWRERILPREFKYDKTAGMFEEFFANVMGRGESAPKRMKSPEFKRSVWYYGYMLHTVKRQSMARAWMLYDTVMGKNGRTGKTIIGNSLKHVRSVAYIDGKRADLKDRFTFQNVHPWTNILFIDDPKKDTTIDLVYNAISGSFNVEKKGQQSFDVQDVKVMFASNFIMENEGQSDRGRQFVSQASNFYKDYAAKKNKSLTPIVAYHGKEFFTDWDAKDWQQFDSFVVRCLQNYFASAMPSDDIIGNSKAIRFMQQKGEDAMFDLCVAFKKNAFQKGENVCISSADLMAVISDNFDKKSGRYLGGVVREFLAVIGFGDASPTTLSKGAHIFKGYSARGTVANFIGEINKIGQK